MAGAALVRAERAAGLCAEGDRKMQGIYVPYWTFDAQARSAYWGERGTVCYVNQQSDGDD